MIQPQKQRATLTVKLPNGQTLSAPMATAALRLLSLLTYPARIGAGYTLLGWRGALFIAVLIIVRPIRVRQSDEGEGIK